MLSDTAARTDLGYLASRHHITPFALHRPVTAAEACGILDHHGPRAVPMGGGVDLSNRLKGGERVDHVVYLRDAADLTGIEPGEGWLRVGAAVTHQQFADDPTVDRVLPGLGTVWRAFGNPRVRSAGTLGGNVITAAPHYDAGPVLAALGARLVYHDRSHRLLSRIDFPITGPIALRYEKAYKPVASVAVAVHSDGMEGSRVLAAVGCAYPEPTTAGLRGPAELSEYADAAPSIARCLSHELPTPIDDHVASAAYRHRLIEVLVRRLLAEIATSSHSAGSRRG